MKPGGTGIDLFAFHAELFVRHDLQRRLWANLCWHVNEALAAAGRILSRLGQESRDRATLEQPSSGAAILCCQSSTVPET
jgi:hypothetical protein